MAAQPQRQRQPEEASTSSTPDQPPPAAAHGDGSHSPRKRGWRQLGKRARLLAAAGAITLGVLAAAFVPLYLRERRPQAGRRGVGGTLGPDSTDELRIPLKEVVRFKERQWFLEELEASREGDANAMLRLAKMYLHGQGCEKNPAMAHEWLRKARYMGVFCTLEELYAGDDWQEAKAAAAAAARREEKRQLALAGAAPPRQAMAPGAKSKGLLGVSASR